MKCRLPKSHVTQKCNILNITINNTAPVADKTSAQHIKRWLQLSCNLVRNLSRVWRDGRKKIFSEVSVVKLLGNTMVVNC